MNRDEERREARRFDRGIAVVRHIARVLAHKWFVLVAGLRVGGIPLRRLVIHDLSKFSPVEVRGYSRQFFAKRKDPEAWKAAWHHHVRRNPHHWEYWRRFLRVEHHTLEQREWPYFAAPDEPADYCVEMPEVYAREMVADWLAASRAYGGAWPTSLSGWDWWRKNRDRIELAPETRAYVEAVLRDVLNP